MITVTCKECGAKFEVQPESRIAICPYCDAKETLPVFDDPKKLRLMESADDMLRRCEFDRAAAIYETVVTEFPTEAEAFWGLVLCHYGIEYVDDPRTGKRVPTCHRLSYSDIRRDDSYLQALECASEEAEQVYRSKAITLERLRRQAIEKVRVEDEYDVFISYKEKDDDTTERTEDSVLAGDLYKALTQEGYRVFYSRITLLDKAGSEYEPLIFSALNSARIMLVVGTRKEYLDSNWVRNEWGRFLKIKEKDFSRELVVCYMGMSPSELPTELRQMDKKNLANMGAQQEIVQFVRQTIPKKEAFKPSGNESLLDRRIASAISYMDVLHNYDAARSMLLELTAEAGDRYEVWWALARLESNNFQNMEVSIKKYKQIEAYVNKSQETANPEKTQGIEAQWAQYKRAYQAYRDHTAQQLADIDAEYSERLRIAQTEETRKEEELERLRVELGDCEKNIGKGKDLFSFRSIFSGIVKHWKISLVVFILLSCVSSMSESFQYFIYSILTIALIVILAMALFGMIGNIFRKPALAKLRVKREHLEESISTAQDALERSRRQLKDLQQEYQQKRETMLAAINGE